MNKKFNCEGKEYNVNIVDGFTYAIFESGKIEMAFETSMNFEHKRILYVYVTDNTGNDNDLWCISFIDNVEYVCNRIS